MNDVSNEARDEKGKWTSGGAADVTTTPEFKAWFGKSKVVDADGKPMMVYHGSANKFDVFDPAKSGNVQYSDWGKGVYLTPSKSTADYYRTEAVKHADPAYNAAFERFEKLEKALPPVSDSNSTPAYTEESRQALREFQDIGAKLDKTTDGQVYEVYASIKNPWVEPYSSMPDPFLAERAKAHGNDGLFIMSGGGDHIDEIIAFSPEQVKSAKGNTAFEPKDPNIFHEGAPPSLIKSGEEFLAKQRAASLSGGVIDPGFPLGEHMPFIRVADPAKKDDVLRVAQDAAPIAAKLGFDPSKMNVTDDNKTFMLNGTEHPEAGHFDPQTGTVTVRTQYATAAFLPELVTHEVAHAKFQAFLDDYKKEHDAVMKDPASETKWVKDETGKSQISRLGPEGEFPIRRVGMKADGTLDDELAKKYPLYQAYTKFQIDNPSEKMQKEDGCTPYSKDWWTAFNAGTATQQSAYHETIAEMASLRSKPYATPPLPPENTSFGQEVRTRYDTARQDMGMGPATTKSLEDWWADSNRSYAVGPNAAPPTAVWNKDLNGPDKGAYLLKAAPSKSWDSLYAMVDDNWKKKHAS